MTTYTTRLIEAISAGGMEARRQARHVRTKCDSVEQSVVLSEIIRTKPEAVDVLVGTPFPQSCNEIWHLKTFPFSSSQRAIQWSTTVFKCYSHKIKQHVEAKAVLDNAVLCGDWEQAHLVLNAHKQSFGFTLWGLRWQIHIAEEQRGRQQRIQLVESYNSEDTQPIVYAFALLFGIACDTMLSEDGMLGAVEHLANTPDKTLSQFARLLGTFNLETKWSTSSMLSHSEVVPLVDRYETFLQLAICAIADQHTDAKRFQQAVAEIAEACGDPLLRHIAECSPGNPVSELNDLSFELISGWDEFMTGNYAKAREKAAKIIEHSPGQMSAQEILVKASLYLNFPISTGATPLQALKFHLYNIFGKNASAEESLSAIRRFASRFPITSTSTYLRSIYELQSSDSPEMTWTRRASFASTAHSPRNFESGYSLAIQKAYLEKLHSILPSSQSVAFLRDLIDAPNFDSSTKHPNIPIDRHRFFSGILALRQEANEEAGEFLAEFLRLQSALKTHPASPFGIEEARRSLVDIYRITGATTKMQQIVVDAYIDRPQSTRRLSIARVYKAVEEKRAVASEDLAYPIISFLASDDPHVISLALRRYLRHLGLKKPSDLLCKADLNSRILSCLLLRVCTPEVLDSFDCLHTDELVQAERLHLLEWVSSNVASDKAAAQAEMLRLTQQSQLRGALQKIEGGRVVVNVASLREAEEDRFRTAYFRYAAQKELDVKKAPDFLRTLTIVSGTGAGPSVVVVTGENRTAQQQAIASSFAAAFRDIRDAFVNSPHFGIEASLSARIRHGIVIQHIRKAFVERRLVIGKDSNEQTQATEHWATRLCCPPSSSAIERIVQVLLTLTNKVNGIAETVRSEWLQSKTEGRNPQGLFDFAFSDAELTMLMRTKFADVSDASLFQDRVFEILLDRTRASLKEVRSRITKELRRNLAAAIESALRDVQSIGGEVDLSPLKNDLTDCLQRTEGTCDQMKTWFEEADATLMGDTSIELVARTAVGMVEQLNPDFIGKHSVEAVEDQRVLGRHFTSLVHILFFLLENAIKHSTVARTAYATTLAIRAKDKLTIVVTNQMESSSAAESACSRINSIVTSKTTLEPEKVLKEGGSGFAKLLSTVKYGFKQHSAELIAIPSGSQLAITLICDSGGLLAV